MNEPTELLFCKNTGSFDIWGQIILCFGKSVRIVGYLVVACLPCCLSPLNASITKSISDQIRSVAQSCPTLCDPINRSMPGLPVHHQLPEFTETHVHRVSDAILPSHPVVPFSSCPQSLPASESFPMSQLFA